MKAQEMKESQRKFLLNELGKLTGWNGSLKPPQLKEPASFKLWNRTMERFAKKQMAIDNRFKRDLEKATSEIRRMIYFGTPEDALKMLRALEKKFSR